MLRKLALAAAIMLTTSCTAQDLRCRYVTHCEDITIHNPDGVVLSHQVIIGQ